MSAYNVRNIAEQYDFIVNGVSYIGSPKPNTAMYVAKKVSHLIKNLEDIQNCLVFAEEGIEVPDKLKAQNCFVFCRNPQLSYAKFVNDFAEEKQRNDSKRRYKLTDGGYYLGENVQIGQDSYIEPGCLIGHDVVIGSNAVILAGSTIKNAVIGDYFFCNENAVVGSTSFTMYIDENGNKHRIATLGKVIIGNHVEIGACNNIAAGGCGDTVIENYVKLDGLIHIGHEAHLHKNAELTAGIIVAGFADIGENAYVGINSSIKNRISVGNDSIIGMGSNVTRNVEAEKTVVGNPAKVYIKDENVKCKMEQPNGNIRCMADNVEIGNSYTRYIVANEQTIRDIARVSGDANPIHLDEEYAKKSVFGKRIAHALFCINGISMVIGNYFPGEGAILISQEFQYIQPVYIDDVIAVTVTVADILPKSKYLLETVCKNQEGSIVLKGKSLVKWENMRQE